MDIDIITLSALGEDWLVPLSEDELAKSAMDKMEEIFSSVPDIRQFIERISKSLHFDLSREAAIDLCDITEQYLAGCRSAIKRSDLRGARDRFKNIRKIISGAHTRLETEFTEIRNIKIEIEENGRRVKLRCASGQLAPGPKNDLAIVWSDLENCINLGSSGRLGGSPMGSSGPQMGLPIDQFLHDLERMTVCLDDHLSRWDERYGNKIAPPKYDVLRNFEAQLAGLFERAGNDLYPKGKAKKDEVRRRFFLFVRSVFDGLPQKVNHGQRPETFDKFLQRVLADRQAGERGPAKLKVRLTTVQKFRADWSRRPRSGSGS